ncbi:MAG: DUF58 domain-containing protein [Planctomycetales bacterium]|nr:DUF58 domain-containing protein [Planctomycetales bacterium]
MQTERRTNQGQRWFIDPAALMQIKSLNLRAKAVVEGFTAGLHRSPLRGFSVEFAEYRPYVLGDDPRTVDWKLLARTDRYYVKQFEDETNRRCYIAIDQSKSMDYGTGGYSKAEYGRTLAATLAYYLSLQRDAVGVMTCGVANPDFLPPRHRTGHLQQVMRLLEQPCTGVNSNLESSLAELAGLSRRRGLVVLISDLLTAPESLYQPLGYLKGRGHEILLVRLLERSEIELNMDKSSMLRDMETGREIYVDPALAKQSYRERFEKHESQLIDICHRRGARLMTVTIDRPLDLVLLELISSSGSLSSAAAISKSKEARATSSGSLKQSAIGISPAVSSKLQQVGG